MSRIWKRYLLSGTIYTIVVTTFPVFIRNWFMYIKWGKNC